MFAILSILVLAGLITVTLVLTSPHQHHLAPSSHFATHPSIPVSSSSTHTGLKPTTNTESISEQACIQFLDATSSVDWQTPTLSIPALEQWATPSLATSFASSHRLTSEEITHHTVIPAHSSIFSTPIMEQGKWVIPIAVTITPIPNEASTTISWICQVGKTASGWRIVNLEPLGAPS